MHDDDAVADELASSEDTARILKRRREFQARSLGRWRKLLVAGVATGAAFGALTCQARVCLSQAIGLECSVEGPSLQLESLVQVDAHWVDASPEPFHVLLTAQFAREWHSFDDPLVFSGDPQLVDATLMSTTLSEQEVTIICEPGPGAVSIEVVLPLDCNGFAEAVHVLLDISGDPADGRAVPVTWLD